MWRTPRARMSAGSASASHNDGPRPSAMLIGSMAINAGKSGAQTFFGHEPEFWPSVPQAPKVIA